MGDAPAPPDADRVPDQESQKYGGTPQQQQPYPPNQYAFASQLAMAQNPVNGRSGAFNVAEMAGSLPHTSGYRPGGYHPGAQQVQFSPPSSSPSMMPQYAPQSTMPMASQPFYMPQHPQVQQYFGNPLSPGQQQARPNVGGYYPSHTMMGHHPPNPMAPGYYYPQTGGGYHPHHPAMSQTMIPSQYYPSAVPTTNPGTLAQSSTMDQASSQYPQGPNEHASDDKSRVVRGPPRKPRQSGHAIWVGNLPPQTDLMSLVHHVCKETPGLESLFLISKSNCAFANFRDEQACISAQQKLHDSKFQSVRLVSRLRKSTVEGAAGVTAPTGPASTTSGSQVSLEPPTETESTETEKENDEVVPGEEAPHPAESERPAQQDKFFILKSLTVEDLELSVKTGIWATQLHNEESLNKAFKAADNVYLVFSANKSGEYFGYARMVSPINEDPDAAIEFAPKTQAANDVDLPKAIPTEATEHAPKGRIIDDSARGTIFWETEREDLDSPDEDASDTSSNCKSVGAVGEPQLDDGTTKSWGKPFKLEWLSTARLPFYRTRGLRNPWNSNREVKIARDGTELESSVGRRLIGLFNRVQSPPVGQGQGHVPGVMRPGMMMPGYPPMRAPYP